MARVTSASGRIFDLETLAVDPLFVHLAGGSVPSVDILYDDLRRFDARALEDLEDLVALHGAAPAQGKRLKEVFVDIDTTVMPLFGEQEGALPGTLAAELATRGIPVVSGLAAGVDVVAHEAAIHAGGRTIAVIGTSLDEAYPRTHAALQTRIAREHLVVSPFAVGTPMAGWHFPRRNCLMARIAAATVLVEAGAKSGTRHQVDACLSLGRPVLVHASLLGCGIDWLDVAHSRGQLGLWQEPREALQLLPESLAERPTSPR